MPAISALRKLEGGGRPQVPCQFGIKCESISRKKKKKRAGERDVLECKPNYLSSGLQNPHRSWAQ